MIAEHLLDRSRKIDADLICIPRKPETRDIQGNQDKFIKSINVGRVVPFRES